MSLIQMSVSGTIMIVVIAIIRILGRNCLPKKTFVLLWGIVLLRLLIPFSIPSSWSIYSLVSQNPQDGFSSEVQIDVQDVIENVSEGMSLPTEAPLPLENNIVLGDFVVPVLWQIGMLACMCFFGFAYCCCYKKFRKSVPVCNEWVLKWLEECSLKRTIAVKQSKEIEAPLTYGILKPVILLPEHTDWKNKQQLQYILLHEYIHICHCDVVWKFFAIVAVCVHWFNPMVWFLYVMLNRDIEFVCDACVVQKIGEDTKATYARTLIYMEEKKSGLIPFCNGFSENAIEERIGAIMRTKKTTRVAIFASLCILIGITVVFATSAKAQNKNQNQEVMQQQTVNFPVFDTEDYLIKVIGVGESNKQTYEVRLYCENRSHTQDYHFVLQDATVNGLQVFVAAGITLPAGTSKEHTISIHGSQAAYAGISDVYDRSQYTALSFFIYESSHEADKKMVHIYPQGEKYATSYTRVSEPTDQVVMDNDYVTVIIVENQQTTRKPNRVRFFVENKTNQVIRFREDGILSINGRTQLVRYETKSNVKMYDGEDYVEVEEARLYFEQDSSGMLFFPNCCGYYEVEIPEKLLEANDIKKIESWDIMLQILLDKKIVVREEITIVSE